MIWKRAAAMSCVMSFTRRNSLSSRSVVFGRDLPTREGKIWSLAPTLNIRKLYFRLRRSVMNLRSSVLGCRLTHGFSYTQSLAWLRPSLEGDLYKPTDFILRVREAMSQQLLLKSNY